MRKRGEDRMDPFAIDFDENKEMTDDEDFSIDMTPEYMFQKFEWFCFCWQIGRQTLSVPSLN